MLGMPVKLMRDLRARHCAQQIFRASDAAAEVSIVSYLFLVTDLASTLAGVTSRAL